MIRSLLKIITLNLLLTLNSCDPLFYISMVNNYNEPIYFAIPELNCISLYPDTILPIDIAVDSYLESRGKLKPQDTITFYQAWAPSVEDIFCGNDTLSIYVFNADTVDYYSWDTVVKYNMVLQRYDLSRQDFEDRNESWDWIEAWLYFPPTEAMKHIHMWPPYGTYDEHGRRKDTK